MKNLKVRPKMISAFLIVILLTLGIGIVSIINLTLLNDEYTYAIDLHGKPLINAGHILSEIHSMRAEIRGGIIFVADSEKFKNQEALVRGHQVNFEEDLAIFKESLIREDTQRLYDEVIETYNNNFKPAIDKLFLDGANGASQADLASHMANTIKPAVDLIAANIDECMTIKSGMLDDSSASGAEMAEFILIFLIILAAVTAAISIFLALYISGLISKPLNDMMGYIKQAGETGNLEFREDEWANCDRLSQSGDEIGQTMKAFTQMMRKFVYYGETVEKVSERDLTIDVDTLGSSDTFGSAAKNMVDSLNDMLGEVNSSTSQVSGAAKQIADAAQTLAQGSTEQAATVEQLSSSITLIADKTKTNSKMTDQAAVLANTIKGNAEKGSRQMDEMMKAVEEITNASSQIEKVIKVIDDIAFQTNILALNAAVEAARAGAAGKGFAVVAEEVRNLASKSAEAAKNTGGLIENSIEKANLGLNIATETSASLKEIVTGINESAEIMAQIAQLSDEQASAVAEVNTGIDQVAQVVQQNSATAQESAAAAEEMSSQATVLENLIAQFKLKQRNN
ncbi:MAG: methyl-accepting chemotaxis protein [Eubacterium sp.]|jgi:methyl-accepting chemotaxis protein|nr:methyl-accepting chemotaxis protein [Eubacterium sp.]